MMIIAAANYCRARSTAKEWRSGRPGLINLDLRQHWKLKDCE
jgi:hypothetical protein